MSTSEPEPKTLGRIAQTSLRAQNLKLRVTPAMLMAMIHRLRSSSDGADKMTCVNAIAVGDEATAAIMNTAACAHLGAVGG
jgi:hypothetical protein